MCKHMCFELNIAMTRDMKPRAYSEYKNHEKKSIDIVTKKQDYIIPSNAYILMQVDKF